jgi:hypothetical protein
VKMEKIAPQLGGKVAKSVIEMEFWSKKSIKCKIADYLFLQNWCDAATCWAS